MNLPTVGRWVSSKMADNKQVDTVLSASDVDTLLLQRGINHRLKVTMKGMVTSLSRMMKIHSDDLFIVEVDSCVPILVKDFQLQWHSQLKPGGTYIFHNLIMTTVEKGVSEPQSVMLAWKDSRLTDMESYTDDTCIGRIDSLDNWLMSHGIAADFSNSANSEQSCQLDKNFDNCVNYEGQVTSTEDAKDGFYTIDDKIRLYCSEADLVINTEIYIFNAHLIELDSTPYLVCCEKSLLRVKMSRCKASPSPTGSSKSSHVKERRVSTGLESIFKKCHLTLKEMLSAIKIRDSMHCLKRSPQLIRKAMNQLLCEKSSFLGIPRKSKRFLDLFLHHNKDCPHTKRNIMMNRLPEPLSFSLLKFGVCDKKESFEDTANQRNSFSANHKLFLKTSNKVLVGTIVAGYRNGLYFSEGSENLPLLILEKSNGEPNVQETNTTNLENKDVASSKIHDSSGTIRQVQSCAAIDVVSDSFGQYISQPCLVPNLLNKVILVREFHIVTEQCKNAKEENVENQLTYTYMAFCLKDCLLFDEVEIPRTALIPKSPKLDICDSKSNETSSYMCNIYVETKSPLRANHSTDMLEFEIFGHTLKIVENVENVGSNFLDSQKFSNENFLNKKEKSAKCSQIPMQPYNPSDPKISSKRGKEQNPCKWESISIVFSAASSGCYHFIHPGNRYTLESAEHEFVPSFANSHLQRAAQFCAVRQRIKVTIPVTVSQLGGPTPAVAIEKLPECSIKDILSDGFTDSIVSFCCLVQNRFTVNSTVHETMNSLAFVMANICLQVRELSPDENKDAALLHVYIDTPKNVYNLGLIPGAVIRFHCLERRVSQADNVYCRFTAASSLQVLALHPFEEITRPKHSAQKFMAPVLSDLPKVLLSEMWLFSPNDIYEPSGGVKVQAKQRSQYLLECHICTFFQLIIKIVCSMCREIFVDGKCQGKRCRDDAYPVLKVQAVVLVDDGSSQATVSFHNASLVARLLTLTENQWNDVADGLRGCGQLFISKDGSVPSSPIAQLMSYLCSSSMVLRPCKLAVAIDKKSSFQYMVDQKALDEFQIREVKVAKTSVNTWSLPLLSLECFALEEI